MLALWLCCATPALMSRVDAQSGATPPQFSDVHLSSASIAKFSRLDVSFHVMTTATRPYYPYGAVDDAYAHPEGITVDALVTTPSGAERVVPAFYYVPYQIASDGPSAEALGIVGNPEWRVRFTPSETGDHTIRFRAIDANGQTTSDQVQLHVTDSTARGWIRVNQNDSRFLTYADGFDFVPIAEGRPWAPSRPPTRISLSYAEAFDQDAANGVNLTRVWDQNDGFNLSLEGSYPVWSPVWSQFTPGLGIDLSTTHSGKRAARFDQQESRLVTSGFLQRVAVEPGVRYRLSGYIKTKDIQGRGALIAKSGVSPIEAGMQGWAQLADSGKPPSKPGIYGTARVLGTEDWKQVTYSFKTGASETVVGIWAGVQDSRGTAWFDDIVLQPESDTYNVVSDPGFERHFPASDRGNSPDDPDVNQTVPKGTDINQWAAFEVDRIVDAAAERGIAIQLCSHGDVLWTWDATIFDDPYAKLNGLVVSWTDARHLGYWKRNYRYRVARWGYSPAIFAWEIWNEHGNIPTTGSDADRAIFEFYRDLVKFIGDVDPFDHLITTSQGSGTFSPDFWTKVPLDVVNYHDYITTDLDRYPADLYEDEARFVYELAHRVTSQWPSGSPRKPIIWGEIGTLTTWNTPHPIAASGQGGLLSRHNFLWSGLFSPAFTTPIDWETVTKGPTTRALSAFFHDEGYSRSGWKRFATKELPADSQVESSDPRLRVMGLMSTDGDRLLVWLQNTDSTWAKVVRDQKASVPVSGSFTTPTLKADTYSVEWWDTNTGRIFTATDVRHAGGGMTVSLPSPLASDVALKIIASAASNRHTAPGNP
jgi:hypothetical protein